jgi:hypothetical protein
MYSVVFHGAIIANYSFFSGIPHEKCPETSAVTRVALIHVTRGGAGEI